jgi:Cu/Zn superoxide dismutase
LRRITKAALGGLAGCALALGGTQVAVSAVEYFLYPEEQLANLPALGPFDGASAALRLKTTPDGTNFKLEVSDIDRSAAGDVFGAHLHTHACDETPPGGQPGGPHYNHDVHFYGKAFPTLGEYPSETVAEVSPTTEAWFQFVPNAHGDATDSTFVPFLPVDPDGKMSIVVHLLPTNTDHHIPTPGGVVGSAGGRQACFPIDATEWAPKTP